MSKVIKYAQWQETPRSIEAPVAPKKPQEAEAEPEVDEEAVSRLMEEIARKEKRAEELLQEAEKNAELLKQEGQAEYDRLLEKAKAEIDTAGKYTVVTASPGTSFELDDFSCVDVSFPDFLRVIRGLSA